MAPAPATPPCYFRSPRSPLRRPQTLAHPFKGSPGHVDPTGMSNDAVFPDYHLAEGSVNINTNHASHLRVLPSVGYIAGAAGDTTTTDSRSRRNRASRRGGQLLTRALGSSCVSACPHFVLPVPLSRWSHHTPRCRTPQRNVGTEKSHTGYQCGRGAASFAAQDHQDPRQLPDRRGGTQAVVSRHQERRRPLAAAGRMDCRDGAGRQPLPRAGSRDGALMIATDITAPTIIAWTEPSPSSPAPAARRCAASGLDRSVRPGRVVGHAVDANLQCLKHQTHLHRNLLHKTSDIPWCPMRNQPHLRSHAC